MMNVLLLGAMILGAGDGVRVDAKKVTAVFITTADPVIIVTAKGQVGSAGWTNPRLVPRLSGIVGPAASPDGYTEFFFVATPPSEGFAASVVTTVTAKTVISHVSPELTYKIRVYGLQDWSVEYVLQGKKP